MDNTPGTGKELLVFEPMPDLPAPFESAGIMGLDEGKPFQR